MNDCLTWASLSDKAALEEPLTAEEQLFLRSHPSQCAACATEAGLWHDLDSVLEEPERLTSAPGGVARRPSAAAAESGLTRVWASLLRRPRLTAAASIGLVAAAAALVVVSGRRAELAPVVARQAPSARAVSVEAALPPMQAGARLALAAGQTVVDGRAGVAGEALAVGSVISVAAGQACVLAPPGVSVCLDGGSELSIEKLEARERRFRLHAGHVVAHLDPQPPQSSFGFETAAGSVVAKGTVFSLRSDGSNVTLRVHEGTVLNSRGAETSAYQAPSAALLSRARPSHPVGTSTADSRLVDLARYFSDSSQAVLIVAAAAGSSVLLGDFSLGMAPVSALVRPGDYRMEVARPGLASIVERLTFEPESRIARTYEASAGLEPAPDKPGSKQERSATASNAAALLEQARELRSGRRYAQASAVYQRLLREHPGSAEARVALVSLGELQLSRLNDAAGALRSFDAYLRGGGALSQEASYGRIRALRRLGKVSEARAATDAFLRAYPNSVQASTLRKEQP